MDANKINTQSAISFVTGIISAGMFFLMNVLNWFLAYSSQILIVSGVLLLLSVLVLSVIQNPKIQQFARYCVVFCGVMVTLSIAGAVYATCLKSTSDKNALLCDYTESALDGHMTDLPWMNIEKLQDNTVRFFIGKRDKATTEELCHRYTILPSILAGRERDTTIVSPIYPLGGAENAYSRTRLVAFNTELARPGFEDEYLRPLPSSVAHTAAGLLLLNKYEWKDAIQELDKAFDEDNGVAGYYLYFVYSNGFGPERDQDLATQYLKQSADLGYRKAQVEYGQQLLAKGGDVDIALGIKYLKRAVLLSEYRTPPVMAAMHKAINTLLDYYIETEQFEKAYSFTKDIIKKNKLDYLNYQYHLDNCLRTGRYSEASDIIQRGAKSKDPQEAGYCKVVQARMFHEGLGVEQDLRKAELALRYASDSLDYPFARKMLAEFYSAEGYTDEAAFWQRLYDIRFRSTIKE